METFAEASILATVIYPSVSVGGDDTCITVSVCSYAEYWKSQFTKAPITDFAPVIRTNTRSDGKSVHDYCRTWGDREQAACALAAKDDRE